MKNKLTNFITSIVSVAAMILVSLSPVVVKADDGDENIEYLENVDLTFCDEQGNLITDEAPLFMAYGDLEIGGKKYTHFCTAAKSYEKAKEKLGETLTADEIEDQLYIPNSNTELGHINLEKIEKNNYVWCKSTSNEDLLHFAYNDFDMLMNNTEMLYMMGSNHLFLENENPIQYTVINTKNAWLQNAGFGDGDTMPFFNDLRVFCVNSQLSPIYNAYPESINYYKTLYSNGGKIDENYSKEVAQRLKQFYCVYKSILAENGLSETQKIPDEFSDLKMIFQIWVWMIADNLSLEVIEKHFPAINCLEYKENQWYKEIERRLNMINAKPEIDLKSFDFKGYGKENGIHFNEVSNLGEYLEIIPCKGMHIEREVKGFSAWIDETFDGGKLELQNTYLQKYADDKDSSLLYTTKGSPAEDKLQNYLKLGGRPETINAKVPVSVKEEIDLGEDETEPEKEVEKSTGHKTGIRVFNPIVELVRAIVRLI